MRGNNDMGDPGTKLECKGSQWQTLNGMVSQAQLYGQGFCDGLGKGGKTKQAKLGVVSGLDYRISY